MKEIFLKLKYLLAGKWNGEGYAKFPTINNTAYKEELEFVEDAYKDAIYFNQKTWYKNETEKNRHTVFWDTGFIILKEDAIVLHSVQIGGRIELFKLTNANDNVFAFTSNCILNDPKTTQSQRIFSIDETGLHYELNMATHEAEFQNHLKASLKKLNT